MHLCVKTFVILVIAVGIHSCIHDQLEKQPLASGKQLYPSRRSANWAALRVKFDMKFFVEPSKPTKVQTTLYVSSILGYVNDRLQRSLSVVPVVGNLTVPMVCGGFWQDQDQTISDKCAVVSNSQLCGDVQSVPPEYLGPLTIYDQYGVPSTVYPGGIGVANTDLLIFVTAVNSRYCVESPYTLAYASTCRTDQYDRPIVGNINFCLYNPSATDLSLQDQRAVALHETFHILGVSSALFPFYRDEVGNPRTPRCPGNPTCTLDDFPGKPPWNSTAQNYVASTNTIKSSRFSGKDLDYIVTPAIRNVVQSYFACSTLPGVPLEDNGGDGTVGSHFKEKFLLTELMTGTMIPEFSKLLSEFSLALLKDSGWYQVDMSGADDEALAWGRGAGCRLFSTSSCDTSPFCTNVTSACSFDRSSISICMNPADFFDGCKLYYPYSNGRCDNKTGHTNILFNCASQDCRGSFYGTGSACFESSLMLTGYANQSLSKGCYAYRCNNSSYSNVSGGAITFKLEIQGPDGTWRACNYPGQALSFPKYTGIITCPIDTPTLCMKSCLTGRCPGAIVPTAKGVSTSSASIPVSSSYKVTLGGSSVKATTASSQRPTSSTTSTTTGPYPRSSAPPSTSSYKVSLGGSSVKATAASSQRPTSSTTSTTPSSYPRSSAMPSSSSYKVTLGGSSVKATAASSQRPTSSAESTKTSPFQRNASSTFIPKSVISETSKTTSRMVTGAILASTSSPRGWASTRLLARTTSAPVSKTSIMYKGTTTTAAINSGARTTTFVSALKSSAAITSRHISTFAAKSSSSYKVTSSASLGMKANTSIFSTLSKGTTTYKVTSSFGINSKVMSTTPTSVPNKVLSSASNILRSTTPLTQRISSAYTSSKSTTESISSRSAMTQSTTRMNFNVFYEVKERS